jgi:hypothetical protein
MTLPTSVRAVKPWVGADAQPPAESRERLLLLRQQNFLVGPEMRGFPRLSGRAAIPETAGKQRQQQRDNSDISAARSTAIN